MPPCPCPRQLAFYLLPSCQCRCWRGSECCCGTAPGSGERASSASWTVPQSPWVHPVASGGRWRTTSSWKVWAAAESLDRFWKLADPDLHPWTGSYAAVLAQVSEMEIRSFNAWFERSATPHSGIWCRTFVTWGEERGPLRLVLFICSDDRLFFPGCNTPCLVVRPSAFFLVSGIL